MVHRGLRHVGFARRRGFAGGTAKRLNGFVSLTPNCAAWHSITGRRNGKVISCKRQR
jgi:hypothetical protein